MAEVGTSSQDRVEANFTSAGDFTPDIGIKGLFSVSIKGTTTGDIILERRFTQSGLSTSEYGTVKTYTDEEIQENGESIGPGWQYRLRAAAGWTGDVDVVIIKE